MIKKLLPFVGILVAATLVSAWLIDKGVIVFDHSGEQRGEGVYWNNTFYIPCSGEYTEGKTIAKTNDGFSINQVEEDTTHTFIVLRNFLDQYLLVREDYEIPTTGKISTVFWNGELITDKAFFTALSEIIKTATTDFTYKTDGIFKLKDNQKMRILYVGYDDCPVATSYIGYMGKVNGTWYITTGISDDQHNDDGYSKLYKISCYTIPNKYIKILDKYFQFSI
ncbi:MAG: hypothetical protein ACRCSR_02285 [Bacteroidales bacterium]